MGLIHRQTAAEKFKLKGDLREVKLYAAKDTEILLLVRTKPQKN